MTLGWHCDASRAEDFEGVRAIYSRLFNVLALKFSSHGSAHIQAQTPSKRKTAKHSWNGLVNACGEVDGSQNIVVHLDSALAKQWHVSV